MSVKKAPSANIECPVEIQDLDRLLAIEGEWIPFANAAIGSDSFGRSTT